jgi:hypothetical protein
MDLALLVEYSQINVWIIQSIYFELYLFYQKTLFIEQFYENTPIPTGMNIHLITLLACL